MQEARMIGYRVDKYATQKNVSYDELSSIIGCGITQFKLFIKGRAFVSFNQLSLLAQRLGVEVSSLLSGDEEGYNQSVVNCMTGFADSNNREKILDIIDDYMDVLDSLHQ